MINGQRGLITMQQDQIEAVIDFDVADGVIRAIHIVNNPDKLRGITLSPGPTEAPGSEDPATS